MSLQGNEDDVTTPDSEVQGEAHKPLLNSEPGHSYPSYPSPLSDLQSLRVRLACILLNFLIEMFDQIIIVPQIALFERSICYTYYVVHDPRVIDREHLVDERLCKIEPIQQQLAVLRSWKAFFDALPGR